MDDNGIKDIQNVDILDYINNNALEANSHDVLLATGGPAYGITLVHGAPCARAQDWFAEKTIRQIQDSAIFEFWVSVFELLEELDA